MNKRARQRLIGVTIVILVVVVGIAFLTNLGNASATPATVGEVLTDGELVGRQVEVTGEVVPGSWVSGAKPFVFEITDAETADSGRVRIVWNDQVPGSFGDGTMATVTGVVAEDGSIEAKYLVTKCPSKYESATGSLTVGDLKARSAELAGKTVKVSGYVVTGSVQPAGTSERFRISDGANGGDPLSISYGGGLSTEFVDGAKVVITGSIEPDGVFEAAEVALDEASK